MPGVESYLDDIGIVTFRILTCQSINLAAQQPHEIALARAPLADSPIDNGIGVLRSAMTVASMVTKVFTPSRSRSISIPRVGSTRSLEVPPASSAGTALARPLPGSRSPSEGGLRPIDDRTGTSPYASSIRATSSLVKSLSSRTTGTCRAINLMMEHVRRTIITNGDEPSLLRGAPLTNHLCEFCPLNAPRAQPSIQSTESLLISRASSLAGSNSPGCRGMKRSASERARLRTS